VNWSEGITVLTMLLGVITLPLAFKFASPGSVLIHLGPLAIRWYGLLIASAVLIGVSLSRHLAKRRNVNPELIGDLVIWLVIGAIPCARLYYVLFQWQEYAQNPSQIIAIWKGGIAIHGAILGGILAAVIFARLQKVSFWVLADLIAPSLILGQAIGRWGNFFNSEAFGGPSDLPWKLYIPRYRRPPEFINVEYFHPTFLYESIWNLLVFALLMFLFFRDTGRKPRLKVGTLFLTYMVAYSAGRFWIEGLRTDSLMLLGILRIAQVVSLVGISLGVAGLIWLYVFKRSLPDVVRPDQQDWNLVADAPSNQENAHE
jgi:phosphatidylglycerol:prolipoprotein diacylglycerol transferase